jgi:hypothetical protein
MVEFFLSVVTMLINFCTDDFLSFLVSCIVAVNAATCSFSMQSSVLPWSLNLAMSKCCDDMHMCIDLRLMKDVWFRL